MRLPNFVVSLIFVAACDSVVAEAAPAVTSQDSQVREPSTHFTEIVDEALKQGFRLADRRKRVSTVHTLDPSKHWAFRWDESPAVPPAIFQIELSDDEYSNVVEVQEWQFASDAAAAQAISVIGQWHDWSGWRQIEANLKGHHAVWAEGDRGYFVYSRALMFEPQFERMLKLARP